MATWRADVFVNSKVGRITTEVEAATWSGAKEQIYAKHGDVQQITNLREVNTWGSRSSSNSSGDGGGSVMLIAGMIGLYFAITYWPITLAIGALYVIYKMFS
jgi:hypothetical protein